MDLRILYDKRVMVLILLVILSLGVILFKGVNYGIEFQGGVRIPLTFERDLTPSEMDEVVNTLKTRISSFGLSQVVIRPLPPREVQIELPAGSEESIRQIERIVQKQGQFEAFIGGNLALTGRDIMPGSIEQVRVYEENINGQKLYRWEVRFVVNEEGAQKFAAVAYGHGGEPVYMFLDRPEDALVLIESKHLDSRRDITDQLETLSSLGLGNVEVLLVDDWETQRAYVLNRSEDHELVIVSESFEGLADLPKNKTKVLSDEDMTVHFSTYSDGTLVVDRWKAIGLLTAPRLSEGLAQGMPARSVSVSGSAPTHDEAFQAGKEVRSILSGGRLPVNVILGSTISIPAPLGAHFLQMSLVGGALAFLLIVLFVSLRYRQPRLFVPILLVSIAEIIILIAIIGGFGTIDFAAMAGIIAAMGVSIDAQIIITDEVFKGGKAGRDELKERVNSAFYIITRNVTIAVLAMLPLFFSGIVEIVGFATSTILGAVLGLAISRPAYAAIVEYLELEE